VYDFRIEREEDATSPRWTLVVRMFIKQDLICEYRYTQLTRDNLKRLQEEARWHHESA